MAASDNLLSWGQPVSDPNNPLTQGAPTWADAYSFNAGALQNWLDQQRATSQAMGLWGPNGITPAGSQAAAMQMANMLAMATTAPGGGIRAFHGSPYDFNAFDASKIGTGEGAQAYGHGLYFAGNEGVARSYRDVLAGPPYPGELLHSGLSFDNLPAGGIKPVFAALEKHGGDFPSAMRDTSLPQDVRMTLADWHNQGAEYQPSQSSGRMYEVNIAADPQHFLDWDTPLQDQHPVVQQKLAQTDWFPYAQEQLERGATTDNPTGQDLHNWFRSDFDPAEAAQYLRDAGIPGIRYLDAGSRNNQQYADALAHFERVKASGAQPGSEAYDGAAYFVKQTAPTSNYVVFDPATIEIIRKYGIGALMAGGGAAAATQGGNGQ